MPTLGNASLEDNKWPTWLRYINKKSGSTPGKGESYDKMASSKEDPGTTGLELRGFLRLTRHYCKFVANYAKIASPLTNSFAWTPEATQTFERLTVSVLAMLDFTQQFIVEADASGFGLKVCLCERTS